MPSNRDWASLLLVLTGGLVLVSAYIFFYPAGIGMETLEYGEAVELPEPRTGAGMSLNEALLWRRSVRDFSSREVSMVDLSTILWAAQGITASKESFRTAPSAGALYPLELYVTSGSGVYHYNPVENTLEGLSDGDVRGALAAAALNQNWIRDAPFVIIITGVVERTREKYGDRAERYMFLEAGHAAQNVYLETTALGLGTVVVGAFYDDQVREVLGLPAAYTPIYIMPLGYEKGG
jgi:SagB-type dehydrogenase family enzyme